MIAAMYGTKSTKARSIIILLLLIICKMALVTDGLPIYRQEQDTSNYDDDDLIAGKAFLKMLLAMSRLPSSPYSNGRPRSISEDTETYSSSEVLGPPTTSLTDAITLPTTEFQKTVIRETRSSPQYVPHQRRGKTYTAPPQTSARTTRSDNLGFSETSANSLSEDGMVISVRVSSSVGQSLINKKVSESKEIMETTTTAENLEHIQIIDQTALQSEEHPTIVAEANKSDFSVDEGEPITSDNYHEDANIKIPFHQSVIYHDNPKEPTRARSVSYSTVIQSLPQHPIRKSWENTPQNKPLKQTDEKATDSMAESKDYYVTSKYDLNKPQTQAWRTDYSTATTVKHFEPTERNWGIPEKNYGVQEQTHHSGPIVYGQPERNYEIDEAVSVESNGRVHGVQPSQTSPNQQRPQNQNVVAPKSSQQTPSPGAPGSKKDDDNQKVGYVVEGRNYRKYRVEERTSDGFIVGEYGVVSHNDGSLRGVRYTADGTISPRLIYDALMKFLSL